ncbi:glycosyltransferase [Shewanella olleyana]|uniref:glycosyltransferase family 2 protein n=1 Tax=Shewanella olleyana TaxID=135626 RepID=UPI002010C478|nr:glycosyltransferase family 2 protein [Shewanella olleyana]MCL1067042.1 glycosyltransferase [Shewanella olleyana]
MNSRDKDLVSIITPSYKSKRFIQETIDSVMSQSYSNFEMLIVDDFSPDGSADFIESILPDKRFKLFKLDKNVGAAEARNVALREAKGQYVAFLDSDDTWEPSKLMTHINYMKSSDAAFTFSSYNTLFEDGKRTGKVIHSVSKIDFNGYMKNTIIGCLTVVIDASKVKPFTMPNLKSSHDMALWGDILKINYINAHGIPDVLANYRLVSTSNTAKKGKAAHDVWKVYTEYFKFNYLKSFWFFINYAFNACKKRI